MFKTRARTRSHTIYIYIYIYVYVYLHSKLQIIFAQFLTGNFFHFRCVGLSRNAEENAENFMCKSCRRCACNWSRAHVFANCCSAAVCAVVFCISVMFFLFPLFNICLLCSNMHNVHCGAGDDKYNSTSIIPQEYRIEREIPHVSSTRSSTRRRAPRVSTDERKNVLALQL